MKKKQSPIRKLIAASFSLLLSTIMLASSTYAWFTMSREVEVTGMNVKVKTTSNLLISETNQDDSTFTTSLTQDVIALLEPASTINGVDYYYTLDAAADGHKVKGPDSDNPYFAYAEVKSFDDTSAKKTKYDENFNSRYGIDTAGTTGQYNTAYGYIDYTFYLKAVSTEDNQHIVMKECNLLYNGEVVTDKAWRVAIFTQEVAAKTESTNLGDLVTILALDSAENHLTGKAANSVSTRDTVLKASTAVVIEDDIDKDTTKYYKVTARIWLEGEDKDCTVEKYAKQTEAYSLDLKFILDTETNGITKIGSEKEEP